MTGLIVPTWAKAAGAAALLGATFYAGWTAHGWRRDSIENKALRAAATSLDKASADLTIAGLQLEKDRSDEDAASVDRQREIRTVYSTTIMPGECSAPDRVVRVLDDAVARANARAAGEPLSGLPAPAGAAGAPAGP